MPGSENSSAKSQPAQAGHARLVLNETVTFFCTTLESSIKRAVQYMVLRTRLSVGICHPYLSGNTVSRAWRQQAAGGQLEAGGGRGKNAESCLARA